MKIRVLLYFTLALSLAGCSILPQQATIVTDDNTPLSNCYRVHKLFDQAIIVAGVMDAEAKRLPGFPYFRSNRFLASIPEQSQGSDYQGAWLEHLITLDQQGKSVELANLPTEYRQKLQQQFKKVLGKNKPIEQSFRECATLFKEQALASRTLLKKIARVAKVDDDYSLFKRTIGLYPLIRYAVHQGFQQWQRKNLGSFLIPDQGKQWIGKAVTYLPNTNSRTLNEKTVAEIIKRSKRPPLNIPLPEKEKLIQLAKHFAPAFLIDVAGRADKIGKPFWKDAESSDVDSNTAVAFVRLSHTWFNNKILPQLVYTIWFSERRKQSSLDILAGKLDGIIWRITIGEDGAPLIADTIHPCGCYHLFFPGPGIDKKPAETDHLEEAILTPQNLPEFSPGNRLRIRLASNSHYVEALSNSTTLRRAWGQRSYRLVVNPRIPDFELRSMPLASGQHKSLYQQDGIVKGSERLERWILWPMGIKNPGAMRQWGKHATAFVGKRHFDDPHLLDHYFIKTGK